MPDKSKPATTTRRQFIKGASLAGAASVFSANSAAASATKKSIPVAKAQAKNVIFLVVDGMCTGTMGLAHHWSLRNRQQPMNWMQLYSRSDLTRAVQDTASASSPVTDSAAAASAWGCGQRVNNGSINFSTSGEALTPLLVHAKQAGKATGLVSTCRITHATPAGFASNVPKRNMEDEIAQQYLQNEIDVLLGGGSRHFHEKVSLDGAPLLPAYASKGYQIAKNKRELLKHAGSAKLLGLFDDSHIPYAIDRKNDVNHKEVPGLTEMFEAALKSLSPTKDGFVLQVEGGRVDHAGHANDPAAILHELLEFDRCIPIALDFIKKNPDTLLIVTTDHGTGGCQLDGKGSGYVGSGPALDVINQFKQSFEWLQDKFLETGEVDVALFKKATGIALDAESAAEIQTAIDSKVGYLNSQMTKIVQPKLWDATAVGWTSNYHTSECVDLMAIGPGSLRLPPFIENRQMFGIMTKALGLSV